MALTTNLAREQYVGDGSTAVFYFHFASWETSQIKVYTGNNIEETQVTTGITITLTGASAPGEMASGGYVTFATAPASGLKIAIVRAMPFIQEDVYVSGARFDAHEVEDRLDMDCAERQELWDGVKRSIKVPGTSSLTPEQFSADLIAASQTAVQKAAEASASAASAAGSAVSANNSKTAAANSATAASGSASAASGSATAAGISATNAGNSATAAANSASAANTAKTDSCDCAEVSRKWAIGTISEQPAGSSKYWADIASRIMETKPTIIRWVRTTVIGQTVYQLDNPDPTVDDATKYLVFYGTDLLDTTDYTINASGTPKTITLSEAPQEVLTLTIAYVVQAVIPAGGSCIGGIFGVIGCEDVYVPFGSVPCDGTEYTKAMFPELYTYLTNATPYLKSCNYSDYAAEVAANYSCAKWGLDTVNEKFKVPTIPDGTYLQQAQTTSETGKGYKGSVVYSLENQARAVTVRYFVNVINVGTSQIVLDSKVSKTGDTMTGALHVPVPATTSDDDTVPTTSWVNAKVSDGFVKKTGDTMTGPLTINSTLTTTGIATLATNSVLSASPAAADNSTKIATTAWSNTEFVNVTGDTMSGNLLGSASAFVVKKTTNTGTIALAGGTQTSAPSVDGAAVIACGGGHSSAGQFILRSATNTADVKELRGKPNGELTWNSYNVITAEGGANHGVMTGTLKAPTPAATTNDTTVATTAWVTTKCGNYVLKTGDTMSGALTINSTLTTTGIATLAANSVLSASPAAGDNTTKIATTAWCNTAFVNVTGDTMTGALKTPTPAAGLNDTTVPTTAWCNSAFIKKTGDTMTGTLYVPTPATTANDTSVPTTAWVNSKVPSIANCVNKTGDTMTGPLIINSTLTTSGVATLGTSSVLSASPAATDNSKKIATTEWVRTFIQSYLESNNYVRATS